MRKKNDSIDGNAECRSKNTRPQVGSKRLKLDNEGEVCCGLSRYTFTSAGSKGNCQGRTMKTEGSSFPASSTARETPP